jgi:16S rRNA (cytosine967-C5)-methyltransferase
VSAAGRRAEQGAATRGLAARSVAAVLGEGRTLDQALAVQDLAPLQASDRALVRDLAYGALRWHQRHRALLALLLERPLPVRETLLEALLSVGLFQLLDAGRPEYASVSATVEAARWLGRARAAGLVNATLRRMQRERDDILARALVAPEARYSHPAWLVGRLRADWPDRWESVLEAAQGAPPLWLRVNVARTTPAACASRLQEAGLAHEAGDLPASLRLSRAVPVAEIPGFADGLLTVQDLASQLAAHILAPTPGMRVLDACAAPGGKTTHLQELAGGTLDLTALDVDSERLARVRENLGRLGLGARVIAADATTPADWWDDRPFDAMLVDAPCSGTGVIRRHPDIKCLRRESDIAPFAARQLALLQALWPLLRTGGRLLYVTCSILKAENSDVVTRFLAGHSDARLVAPATVVPAWAEAQPAGDLQALPGPADTDGLYYALMTRARA